jgi:predicted ATP-grasp superfamily ATP-dependent carboligase
MALAKEEDIRVPETALVSSMAELRTWLGQHGFPALLKTDGSAGGRGVRVVTCMDDAERAFRFLGSPPSLARTAKRAIVDRDRTWIRSYLLRRRPALIVQEFVAGHEATCTVACWEGQIRAIIVAEVLRNWESRGPASVVRLVQNEAILSAAAKIVLRLRMSNLCGFDFVIEGRTGQPYLIEMNARATQTAHLALGPGRDLPAAIHAAIAGTPVRERDRVTNNDVIALFPLEWQRDPASKFLQCGYHDVPWDETRLVREALRPRWTFREYRQPSPAEHSVPVRAKLP